MQIKLPFSSRRGPNHRWNAAERRWELTDIARLEATLGKWPRIRYSHDTASWYDKATGELHSPLLRIRVNTADTKATP
jgi:hypothetical protein